MKNYVGLKIHSIIYKKNKIASLDVDSENCFTPYCMGDKFILHYQFLSLDPMTKIAAFSDNLNY